MTNAAILVALNGQQLVLSSVTVNGASVTVYSDAASSQAVTLPTTLSTDTTLYLAAGVRGYALAAFRESDGTALASEGGIVMANHVASLQPSPTMAGMVANANRARTGGAEFFLDGTVAAIRKNLRRQECAGNLAALTTQVMTAVALPLEAGDVVTSLTFVSATTAAGTPTNWWYALYSTAATPALLAQTADQTNTAWAANTAKTVALAAPYTVTASGVFYAAVMVKATTPPTLAGASLHNAVEAGAIVTGQKVLALTSGAALTDTAPATLATPTTVATVPLVIAT